MAILADRESQLLIDGKLVAGSAGTFPTVNPATEEVLGVAADASIDDMGRAIDAARRAFDDTDWSTDAELRVRCIRQLQQALRDHADELRELAIAEVGAPRMLTSMAQFDGPVEDLSFCADTAESLPVDHRLRHRVTDGHQDAPHHRQGGDRRRRRHHAVELPEPDQPRQDRARTGGGQHGGAQACARHPVVRCGARSSSSSSTPTSRRASSTSSPPATTVSVRCCRRIRASTWCRSPGRRTPGAP